MSMTKIIVSPTGTTGRVADILAHALDDEVNTIDLCDPDTDFSAAEIGDMAVIAMPCFAGRMPDVARDRLRLLKADHVPAIVVAVYGNRAYDDLLLETADVAKEVGFTVIAGVAAVAEHSMVRQFATGRPNEDDAATLRVFASQIGTKLAMADYREPALPGKRPYKEWKRSVMYPIANDDCIQCGACAAACPTGAIDMTDAHKLDTTKCICCMRCISLCPMEARDYAPEQRAMITERLREACSVYKDYELYI